MTGRAARVLAWSIGGVTMLLAVARVVLAIVDPASSDASSGPKVPGGGVPVAVYEAAILIALAVIGAVVASRQPRNAVGWILCVIPLFLGILVFNAHLYWTLALDGDPHGTAAELAAWLGSWTWVPVMIPTVTFFPLLFPTGRPLTARWRPVVWLAGLMAVLVMVTELFRPGPLQEYPAVDNPLGVAAAGGALVHVSDAVWVATTLLSLASLVVRFRRSRGDERQQIKWVAAAALMFVALFIASALIQSELGQEDLGFAVALSGFLFIASAVAVAVMRYRLYDIDVVINRALVYTALTATLAGTYLGSVLLLQLVLSRFTEGSGLAVAVSTLATAALVRPARARIKDVVDRRFYRRKYDAARTLDAFGARLRDAIDLELVKRDLCGVAGDTMQSAHVTLWLRSPETVTISGRPVRSQEST